MCILRSHITTLFLFILTSSFLLFIMQNTYITKYFTQFHYIKFSLFYNLFINEQGHPKSHYFITFRTPSTLNIKPRISNMRFIKRLFIFPSSWKCLHNFTQQIQLFISHFSVNPRNFKTIIINIPAIHYCTSLIITSNCFCNSSNMNTCAFSLLLNIFKNLPPRLLYRIFGTSSFAV